MERQETPCTIKPWMFSGSQPRQTANWPVMMPLPRQAIPIHRRPSIAEPDIVSYLIIAHAPVTNNLGHARGKNVMALPDPPGLSSV